MSRYNFHLELAQDSTMGASNWVYSLEGGEILSSEIISRDDQLDLSHLSVRVSLWIEQLEALHKIAPSPGDERFKDFYEQFDDVSVRRMIRDEKNENSFVKITHYTDNPKQVQEAAAVFFIAICLYLSKDERYIHWNARIIYLFSAWQAYNLLKSLCRDEALQKIHLETMAECYNRLTRVLDDRAFRGAVRLLAHWGRYQNPEDPLLRQHLRRSLILGYRKETEPDLAHTGKMEEIIPRNPIIAPGAFASPLLWKEAALHPVYAKEPGIRAVRQLITERTLPAYDFESSINLAFLLKNTTGSVQFLPWLKRLPLISAIFTLLIILLGTILISPTVRVIQGVAHLAVAACEIAIIGSTFWVVLRKLFDTAALPYLAMPRMLGGIVVGYTVFIAQGDAVKIVNGFTLLPSDALLTYPGNPVELWFSSQGWIKLFWGGLPLVMLLWIGVLIIGYLYLYFDAQPWAGDKKESSRRALNALWIALLSSAMIGLAFDAIISAAYGISTPYWGSLLGPFGWFDIKQWLVFTPLALITGLVSQFLLEDRTLAASVWAPEQF